MTKFEQLTNAHDYLAKYLCESDRIVDIYEIDDMALYKAIFISKNHVVYRCLFSPIDNFFKVKVLE